MSTNCLVTKLKAVVDNDTLPILSTLRVTFPVNVDYSSSYASAKFAEGETPESAQWRNGSTIPIEIDNTNHSITVRSTNAINDTLLIKDKAILTSIEFNWGNGRVELTDLSGTNVTSLNIGIGNSGDSIDMIPESTLKKLTTFTVGAIEGDIKKLNACIDLTTLLCNINPTFVVKSNIYGNLSSISNITKLKKVIVPRGCSGYISQLNCDDTLEEFQPEENTGYADNDASLWANKFKKLKFLKSWSSRVVWNSPSLRNSAYPVINAHIGFASATDCDNFLINMSECLDNGLYDRSDKTMWLQTATRTSASDAAINKFEAAGWTINGVTKQ